MSLRALFLAALLALAPAARAETVACDLTDGSTVRCDMSASNVFAGEIPPSLRVWFDFSDDSTITTASGAVSALANKAGIETLTQGDSNLRPTLTAPGSGILGGRQHADFDGSADVMPVDSRMAVGSLGEVWATFEVDVATGAQVVYSEANNSTTAYHESYAIGNSATVPAIANSLTTASSVRGGTVAADTPTVVRWSSSGTAYGIEVNGSTASLTVVSGSDNGNWFGDVLNVRSAIGAYYHNVTNQYLNGQVGEVLVIDGGVLVSWQATQLRTYLARKWGVTVP